MHAHRFLLYEAGTSAALLEGMASEKERDFFLSSEFFFFSERERVIFFFSFLFFDLGSFFFFFFHHQLYTHSCKSSKQVKAKERKNG